MMKTKTGKQYPRKTCACNNGLCGDSNLDLYLTTCLDCTTGKRPCYVPDSADWCWTKYGNGEIAAIWVHGEYVLVPIFTNDGVVSMQLAWPLDKWFNSYLITPSVWLDAQSLAHNSIYNK